MSIEALLTKLIEAIEANTAAQGGAKTTDTKSTGTKSTGTKSTKSKGPTIDDLTAFASKLMKGETDIDADDGRAALKAFKDNRGYKVSETPAEEVAAALEELKTFANGGDPYESEGEGDSDLM